MNMKKLIRPLLLVGFLLSMLTSCSAGGIYTPFEFLLTKFNDLTGSYAIALLLFALIVKILLLPLSIKQQKNQIGAAKLKPRILAIERKYAGRNDQVTQRKKQEEIMALQQDAGYSPLAGCLPLLIQIPIIFILYEIIRNPLTHICKFSEETMTALREAFGSKTSEISMIDKILTDESGQFLDLVDRLPDFGLFSDFFNLAQTPSEVWGWLLVFPAINLLASVATMFLSKRLNGNQLAAATATTQDQRVSSGIMNWMMPVMSTFIAATVPAALGLYWFYQSVLGIVQMLLLAKFMPMPKYTDEELEQMLKDMKARQNGRPTASAPRDPNAPRPRSLHHIDDEDDEPAAKPQSPKKKPQGTGQGAAMSEGVSLKEDRKGNGKKSKKDEAEQTPNEENDTNDQQNTGDETND